MNRTTPTRLALVVALGLGSTAACGGDESPALDAGTTTEATASVEPTGSSVARPVDNEYFTRLCGVLAAAVAGDLDIARTEFDHGPLHELADRVIDVDRAVAASLLEAKEAVESDLDDPATPPAQAVTDFRALTEATLDAYEAVGDPVPPPCDDQEIP